MKYKVTLRGKTYEVEVENGEAMLVDEYEAYAPAAPAPVAAAPAPAAPAPAPVAEGTKITAPMPGMILDVKVAVGDTVKSGQALFVLEAMKMENDVNSTCDGKVLSINTTKGTSVETGTVLAVIG